MRNFLQTENCLEMNFMDREVEVCSQCSALKLQEFYLLVSKNKLREKMFWFQRECFLQLTVRVSNIVLAGV